MNIKFDKKKLKKKIVILTGSEIRHTYFKQYLANDKRFKVLKTYCEGLQKSLRKIISESKTSSELQKKHLETRDIYEKIFFMDYVKNTNDYSNSLFIAKGKINSEHIVKEIESLNPDLLICYGSSLIKSSLLKNFKNRFLNVHLGISPYYKGSGTNIFPIINKEFDMLGATFMHLDEGIDTGKVIHQFRSDILIGDNPHTIGNRVIKKMTNIFADLIVNFDSLQNKRQIKVKGKTYYIKDFNNKACKKLYYNLSSKNLFEYIDNKKKVNKKKIIENRLLINL